MIPPLSSSGQLLWRLLPRVYRDRDGRRGIDPKRPTEPISARGDLANYLDAFGILLDELRGTLEARQLDSLPERCQPWLIPYFADLIDVRLVSPDIEGQREEVARAVSWRKRKGTLDCVADIAARVGRFERVGWVPGLGGEPGRFEALPTVLVQEGFRRVVTTVSIGAPLRTPSELGLLSAFPPSQSPVRAAQNPALPPGTVDFRQISRARQTETSTLATRNNAFSSRPVSGSAAAPYAAGARFQQVAARGVPCHPDTYQDASLRTVDMRTPTHATGHHHPRRVLLWAEPRAGFFSPEAMTLAFLEFRSLLAGQADAPETVTDVVEGTLIEKAHFTSGGSPVAGFCMLERDLLRRDGQRVRTRTLGLLASAEGPRRATRTLSMQGRDFELVAGFDVSDEFQSHAANQPVLRILRGFGAEPPRLEDPIQHVLDLQQLGASAELEHRLEDLVVLGTLRLHAPVSAVRAAIQRVTFAALPRPGSGAPLGPAQPALNAVDSLFDEVIATGAWCRFEYSTVLRSTECSQLEASDSILVHRGAPALAELWLRYACVPWLPAGQPIQGRVLESSITRSEPLFLEPRFGWPGAGVLHPACSLAIREGAEDGGELGAFHHRHHVRREQALLDKLREFLPVTLEPALIPHRPWKMPVP